nr:precorrin-8X methylmutase [Agathobacter sp.]
MTYEQNKIEHVLPQDIESTSMATIRKELQLMNYQLDETLAPVILRCIHTSADFEYADTLCFSDNAIRIAQDLIRKGADIVTDTNMGLSGINKKELAKYGGCVHCFMAEESVSAEAKKRGLTRATVSMEHAAAIDKPIIFAIGNAPTALIALRGLYEKGYRPAFIIGVPVGFVNVVASKEMIMETDIPYIVNRGRKGGSNVAAAICNALLYDMRDQ